jgi:hypothetical protein
VLVVLVVAAALGVTAVGPAAGREPEQRDLARFMWAMAGQESGWDYYARNSSSGAFGKYQIMPFNWPVWARQYLGDKQADQTPYNQEKVASGKLGDLYGWLGTWKRVAYWWLTGRSEKNEKTWSSYAKGYVTNIMALRRQAPADGAAMPARSSSRPSKGDWRRAAGAERLRVKAAGALWSGRGRLRDGQVLRVHAVSTTRRGQRWIAVVTADGRLGWLRQLLTVPARQPARPGRYNDIRDKGDPTVRTDRTQARPRPR